ncbi:tripartite tricarboxylate transporter TctB family protein [Pelagibacterium limicola]|uniref:tripartite tricarboxylate transporter TctB family protein n=1 Tax=Pelagibacterium limicola TaxID=2791022 RepID=UPI0018AFE63B|nr:tripartite tricarboxylate transporter TctB family protein [Pelagibacterium limicola]
MRAAGGQQIFDWDYMRDHKDIIGGTALVAIGGFAAVHAIMTLRLGTIWQMGPGMFPAAVGVLLATIGVVLLITGILRSGEAIDFDLRSIVLIGLSVLAFALLIRSFGLVPAITAVVILASRADAKLSPGGIVILSAILSVVAVLIFQIGLKLTLTAFNWPW